MVQNKNSNKVKKHSTKQKKSSNKQNKSLNNSDERRCCNIDFNWNPFRNRTPVITARVPSNNSSGFRPCPMDERYRASPVNGIPIGTAVSNNSNEQPFLARPVYERQLNLPIVRAVHRVSSNEFGPYKMGYGIKSRSHKKRTAKVNSKKNKKTQSKRKRGRGRARGTRARGTRARGTRRMRNRGMRVYKMRTHGMKKKRK